VGHHGAPQPESARPEALAPDERARIDALRSGDLEVLGRLVGSSNNAMVVRVWPPGGMPPEPAEGGVPQPIEVGDLLAVWKPTRGERPLFDFPLGTLTRREVAAHLVSDALGWGIVPPTFLRDGPFGEGMVQLWIDSDPAADVIAMVSDDDPRLRRIAVLDAVINNTDRKAGHLLPLQDGHLHAVDHGVTFSVVPKLRTVLWAWEGEPFDDEEVAGLARVSEALGSARSPGPLAASLLEVLAAPEVAATRARVDELLATRRFPSPNPEWPAIPWPPY
jgi:uncharacterized repeat protein (TIGR03843 family)